MKKNKSVKLQFISEHERMSQYFSINPQFAVFPSQAWQLIANF